MKAKTPPAREQSVALPGIAPAIVEKYGADQVARWFGPHPHLGDVLCKYARPNGDLTGWVSASRHADYVRKGWTCVEVYEAPPVMTSPAAASAELLEHARHDRLVRWTKADQTMLSSARNATSLIAKGWMFDRLASPREVYLEALPGVPSAKEREHAATLPHD